MNKKKLFLRRRTRNRYWIKLRKGDRLRLSVFRSHKHVYVQIIDDLKGQTLTSASTLDKVYRQTHTRRQNNMSSAQEVGRLIAERAMTLGIDKVVFDRGAYPYHGRVKALAETAREHGLSF